MTRALRQIVAGVYMDTRGTVHVDVPERLRIEGHPNTPIRRWWMAQRGLKDLRAEFPHVLIIARLVGVRHG